MAIAPHLVNPDPDDDEPTPEPLGQDEQDLLVRLRLSNKSLGTARERADIEALALQLEAALTEAGAGEYDGDEWGGGECTLFFCGRSADRMFAVLQPLLRSHPLARGATVQLQHDDGPPVTRRL